MALTKLKETITETLQQAHTQKGEQVLGRFLFCCVSFCVECSWCLVQTWLGSSTQGMEARLKMYILTKRANHFIESKYSNSYYESIDNYGQKPEE